MRGGILFCYRYSWPRLWGPPGGKTYNRLQDRQTAANKSLRPGLIFPAYGATHLSGIRAAAIRSRPGSK